MKKFLWLLVLLLLIVPSFAETALSTKAEFSLKFYPDSKKLNFNPNYYLYFNYKTDNVSAYLDIRDSGWKGGYLTLNDLAGVMDLTLAKYYLTVNGTKALFDTLWYNRNNINGIQLTLNTPIKVTTSYLFRNIESDVAYDTGRLITKAEANISKFSVWGLYDMDLLSKVNTYVVGAEVKPFSLLSAFFEYGNNSRSWAVGGSLNPIKNLNLAGYYRGDGGYNLEVTLNNLIPGTNLYGAYFYGPDAATYMYGKVTLPPLSFGNIDALYGYYTTHTTYDVWYVRLSSKFGLASNTLRIYKGWSFGSSWFDPTVLFTCEDTVSVSF